MIISIHQPNFFPWYPFFQKMNECDVFVILTNCQFEKNGFQNRFNINNKWHTMSAFKGNININEKEYVNPHKDWEKIKKSLVDYKKVLDLFDDCIEKNLSITNIKIIKKISKILSIDTNLLVDYPTSLTSSERLIHICKTNGANKYLSGISGKNYLDIDLFKKNNIDIIFQEETKIEKKSILEKLIEVV